MAFNSLPFPNLEDLQQAAKAQIAEYVIEAFEDSKGHLWFGTMAKGVACYDGKPWTIIPWTMAWSTIRWLVL